MYMQPSIFFDNIPSLTLQELRVILSQLETMECLKFCLVFNWKFANDPDLPNSSYRNILDPANPADLPQINEGNSLVQVQISPDSDRLKGVLGDVPTHQEVNTDSDERMASGGVQLKVSPSDQDLKHIFRFGNSITDFRSYRICTEGREEGGRTMKNGKRRFIWRFCCEYCDKGFQTQEQLNTYVSQKLGRSAKVTLDDIKTLIDVVSRFSGVPPAELKKDYIRFVIGSGIEVKNIP
jgi:hypothetical protein